MQQEPAIEDAARKDPRLKEVLEVALQGGRHGAQLRACTRRAW